MIEKDKETRPETKEREHKRFKIKREQQKED